MDVIEKEKLAEHAITLGDFILQNLYKLKEKYPVIGDVRGMGLFIGIELVTDRTTKEPATLLSEYVVAKFKENFILMSTEGKYGNVLKFKPPMVFNEENATHLLTVFEEILQNIQNYTHIRKPLQSFSSQSSDSINFENFSSDSLSDEDSFISE